MERIVLLVNDESENHFELPIVRNALDMWGHLPLHYDQFDEALAAIEGGVVYDVLMTDLDLGTAARRGENLAGRAFSFSTQFEGGLRIIQASRQYRPQAPVIAWSVASSIALPHADEVWNLYGKTTMDTAPMIPDEWLEDLEQRIRAETKKPCPPLACGTEAECLARLKQYLEQESFSTKTAPTITRQEQPRKSLFDKLFYRRSGD